MYCNKYKNKGINVLEQNTNNDLPFVRVYENCFKLTVLVIK